MDTTKNKSQVPSLKSKVGFTLIELLIVIAVISLLIGVLVPSLDRSMAKNKLANDVEVLRSKIEETRLLAGSTQTNDEANGIEIVGDKRVAYYGVLFPTHNMITSPANYNGRDFYAIVRLSQNLNAAFQEGYCNINTVLSQSMAGSGSCVVERIDLAKGVKFNSSAQPGYRVLGYKVPAQQLVELCAIPSQNINWTCTATFGENPAGPQFNQTNGVGAPYIIFDLDNKHANIRFEPFTGKLSVIYN